MPRATINGFEMHYADVGPRDTEPILFIHGFPLDRSQWDQQLIFFPGRARCIAPDLRGHGPSAFDGPRTIDSMAADVLALLDALRVTRATVCGLSMGGYITFALWRKAPERFSRVILVDTKATADSTEARENRFKLADAVLERGASHAADVQLPKLVAPSHATSPVGRKVRAIIERTTPRSIAETLRALADRADSTPTLTTITVPALVVVGALDALTPLADAMFMRDRIPHAKLAVLQGAGHLSPMEAPADFNLALDEFLDRG